MNVTFSDWKTEDHLTTPEERSAYLMAASEEGSSNAIPDAFADVFRSLGRDAEANACESLAAYIRAIGGNGKTAAQRRCRAHSRKLASA